MMRNLLNRLQCLGLALCLAANPVLATAHAYRDLAATRTSCNSNTSLFTTQAINAAIVSDEQGPFSLVATKKVLHTASALREPLTDPNRKLWRAAVGGAGPAGLQAALDLAKEGVPVTIFEKNKYLGGLPRDTILAEHMRERLGILGKYFMNGSEDIEPVYTAEQVEALGIIGLLEKLEPYAQSGLVTFQLDTSVGEREEGIAHSISLQELEDQFDVRLLAMGATQTRPLTDRGGEELLGQDHPDVWTTLDLSAYLHGIIKDRKHLHRRAGWPRGTPGPHRVAAFGFSDGFLDSARNFCFLDRQDSRSPFVVNGQGEIGADIIDLFARGGLEDLKMASHLLKQFLEEWGFQVEFDISNFSGPSDFEGYVEQVRQGIKIRKNAETDRDKKTELRQRLDSIDLLLNSAKRNAEVSSGGKKIVIHLYHTAADIVFDEGGENIRGVNVYARQVRDAGQGHYYVSDDGIKRPFEGIDRVLNATGQIATGLALEGPPQFPRDKKDGFILTEKGKSAIIDHPGWFALSGLRKEFGGRGRLGFAKTDGAGGAKEALAYLKAKESRAAAAIQAGRSAALQGLFETDRFLGIARDRMFRAVPVHRTGYKDMTIESVQRMLSDAVIGSAFLVTVRFGNSDVFQKLLFIYDLNGRLSKVASGWIPNAIDSRADQEYEEIVLDYFPQGYPGRKAAEELLAKVTQLAGTRQQLLVAAVDQILDGGLSKVVPHESGKPRLLRPLQSAEEIELLIQPFPQLQYLTNRVIQKGFWLVDPHHYSVRFTAAKGDIGGTMHPVQDSMRWWGAGEVLVCDAILDKRILAHELAHVLYEQLNSSELLKWAARPDRTKLREAIIESKLYGTRSQETIANEVFAYIIDTLTTDHFNDRFQVHDVTYGDIQTLVSLDALPPYMAQGTSGRTGPIDPHYYENLKSSQGAAAGAIRLLYPLANWFHRKLNHGDLLLEEKWIENWAPKWEEMIFTFVLTPAGAALGAHWLPGLYFGIGAIVVGVLGAWLLGRLIFALLHKITGIYRYTVGEWKRDKASWTDIKQIYFAGLRFGILAVIAVSGFFVVFVAIALFFAGNRDLNSLLTISPFVGTIVTTLMSILPTWWAIHDHTDYNTDRVPGRAAAALFIEPSDDSDSLEKELSEVAQLVGHKTILFQNFEILAVRLVSEKILKSGNVQAQAQLAIFLGPLSVCYEKALDSFSRDTITQLITVLSASEDPKAPLALEQVVQELSIVEYHRWIHILWLLELTKQLPLEQAFKLIFSIVAIVELRKIRGGTSAGETMGDLASKIAIALGEFLSRLNEPRDLWLVRPLIKVLPRVRLGVKNDLENAWEIAENLDEVLLDNPFSKELRRRIHGEFSREDELFLDAYLDFLKTGEEAHLNGFGVTINQKDKAAREGLNKREPQAVAIYQSLLELQECLIRVIHHDPVELVEHCRSLASCGGAVERQLMDMQQLLKDGHSLEAIVLSGSIRSSLRQSFFKESNPKELVGIAALEEDLERVVYIQLGLLLNEKWERFPDQSLEDMLRVMVMLSEQLNAYGAMSLSLFELLQALGPDRGALHYSQARDLLRMVLKEHDQVAFVVNANYGEVASRILDNKNRVRAFVGGLLRRSEMDLHRMDQLTELSLEVINRRLEKEDGIFQVQGSGMSARTEALHFTRLYADELLAMRNARVNYGGKAMGMAHMSTNRVPVPTGYAIPSAVWKTEGDRPDFRAWLTRYVDRELEKLEQNLLNETGIPWRYGSLEHPLIVAVRSGSALSLPGMMSTITNLGFNDQIAKVLCAQTGNPWFVYDSYRRFLSDYATSIWGMDIETFHDIMEGVKKDNHVERKEELAGTEMKRVMEEFKMAIIDDGFEKKLEQILANPRLALINAVERVERGWHDAPIHQYREEHEISHHWGTAVSVQRMRFGNLRNESGDPRKDSFTGVAYTRNVHTNESAVIGEYKPNGQGDDLVGAALRRESISSIPEDMAMNHPLFYKFLTRYARFLDRLNGGPQEFEFTVEAGEWQFLQTRNADLQTKRYPSLKAEVAPVARGLGASGGAFRGVVGFLTSDFEYLRRLVESINAEAGEKVVDGILLLAESPGPTDLAKMLADDMGWAIQRGGYMSHAAVNARKEGIPAIIGITELEVDEKKKLAVIIPNSRRRGEMTTIYEGDVYSIDGHSHSGKMWKGSWHVLEEAPQSNGGPSVDAHPFAIPSAKNVGHAIRQDWLNKTMTERCTIGLFAAAGLFGSYLLRYLFLLAYDLTNWREMLKAAREAWTVGINLGYHAADGTITFRVPSWSEPTTNRVRRSLQAHEQGENEEDGLRRGKESSWFWGSLAIWSARVVELALPPHPTPVIAVQSAHGDDPFNTLEEIVYTDVSRRGLPEFLAKQSIGQALTRWLLRDVLKKYGVTLLENVPIEMMGRMGSAIDGILSLPLDIEGGPYAIRKFYDLAIRLAEFPGWGTNDAVQTALQRINGLLEKMGPVQRLIPESQLVKVLEDPPLYALAIQDRLLKSAFDGAKVRDSGRFFPAIDQNPASESTRLPIRRRMQARRVQILKAWEDSQLVEANTILDGMGAPHQEFTSHQRELLALIKKNAMNETVVHLEREVAKLQSDISAWTDQLVRNAFKERWRNLMASRLDISSDLVVDFFNYDFHTRADILRWLRDPSQAVADFAFHELGLRIQPNVNPSLNIFASSFRSKHGERIYAAIEPQIQSRIAAWTPQTNIRLETDRLWNGFNPDLPSEAFGFETVFDRNLLLQEQQAVLDELFFGAAQSAIRSAVRMFFRLERIGFTDWLTHSLSRTIRDPRHAERLDHWINALLSDGQPLNDIMAEQVRELGQSIGNTHPHLRSTELAA